LEKEIKSDDFTSGLQWLNSFYSVYKKMNNGKEGRKMMNDLIKSKDNALIPVILHPSFNFVLNSVPEKHFLYPDSADLGSGYFMCILLGY
jgi:hypothetical protein